MGLFSFFKKQPKRAVTWEQGFRAGLVESPSISGQRVTEDTALGLSTVWRACRVISESIGAMPLKVYKKTDKGRSEARDHSLWQILHDEPNTEQSAVDFFSLMTWWAVLWGNAYAEIEFSGDGSILGLHPIPPWAVTPGRNSLGNIVYEVHTETEDIILDASSVMHIKGPSADGSVGYRIVQIARDSLGFSLAAERFGSSYFANSCKIGGVLKTAGQLSEQARENLKASWAKLYSGVENTGKVPVLEEGLDFAPFSISNEAGQYDQTRQQQVYEVCRWLGIDPVFVYALGQNPGGVAEQQTRNFLQFTLNPWLRKIESEVTRKCVKPSERDVIYPEFVRESLISMDAKTQADVWAVGIGAGWLTIDEVRAFQNLEPLPQPAKQDPQPALAQQTPQEQANGKANNIDPISAN